MFETGEALPTGFFMPIKRPGVPDCKQSYIDE